MALGRSLFVSRSFDGGVTFSSPFLIAKTFASYGFKVPATARAYSPNSSKKTMSSISPGVARSTR
jgi:hypothetical protein